MADAAAPYPHQGRNRRMGGRDRPRGPRPGHRATPSSSPARRPRSAPSRTRRSAWSTRRCRACCRCRTASASARRCAPAWRSTRRSTAGRASTARIISTPICRRAIRSASSTIRWSARARSRSLLDEKDESSAKTHRHRAHPRRAGRGQADARPASDDELRRPQPLRRRADGDRVAARHAFARRSRGLSPQAALDPALCRLVRRQYGRRLDARRRQRQRAQARRRVRHPDRDQERQFGPLRHGGDRA